MLFLFVSLVGAWAADEPCNCPKLKCDPCSFERSVAFYTRTCGTNNSRMKSCARPECVPISEATKDCPVPPTADSGKREPVEVPKAEVNLADPNADTHIVGTLRVIKGGVALVRNERHIKVEGESKLRESEIVEAGDGAAALIEFAGGNRVHVHASTSLEVREYKDQADAETRRAFLQLIKGKIRNQVVQKYGAKASAYRVYTTGAVAGVRGTDFVVEHSEDRALESRVEVLEGHVIFASLDDKQTQSLEKGEGATFRAELPPPSAGVTDLTEFIRKGKVSKPYKIVANDLHALDIDSRVDVPHPVRTIKRGDVPICKNPSAFFNQCAWACVNNPAKEKKCRLDLPDVRCVRSRCNGNGQWAEHTEMPKPVAGGVCASPEPLIKACDY